MYRAVFKLQTADAFAAIAAAVAGALYNDHFLKIFKNYCDVSGFIKVYVDVKTHVIYYLAFVLRPSRLRVIANTTANRNIKIARSNAIYYIPRMRASCLLCCLTRAKLISMALHQHYVVLFHVSDI